MMDSIPRQDERYRFDAFCKAVLKNEAMNYLRTMKRQYEREMTFSDLSYSELQSLCFTEDYPSDSFTFTAHGCELRIDNSSHSRFSVTPLRWSSLWTYSFVGEVDLPE